MDETERKGLEARLELLEQHYERKDGKAAKAKNDDLKQLEDAARQQLEQPAKRADGKTVMKVHEYIAAQRRGEKLDHANIVLER